MSDAGPRALATAEAPRGKGAAARLHDIAPAWSRLGRGGVTEARGRTRVYV
eukprot:CAMPEP_0185545974 /NCGR_PEP_ID=MMETSP1381-20130426/5146_1 /TAXON_ID=298111 /ORGANISM="Pavlova sp., Strain CCMP459" /LENGTH=50 /DNA_ID=CAMNT_0028158355 /DNA_START=498 /DNA_END=651 /DNA_ORIENTATION=+